MANRSSSLLVVSGFDASLLNNEAVAVEDLLSDDDRRNDSLDDFNHPRLRRALILQQLKGYSPSKTAIQFEVPSVTYSDLDIHKKVHSEGLVDFLSSAWNEWESLGDEGRDRSGFKSGSTMTPPALVSSNVPLPRDPHQRPSKHVIGRTGYYCNDRDTPIFQKLRDELLSDTAVLSRCVNEACNMGLNKSPYSAVYAITTHPGHHAARDCFGGYCYLNSVALAARLFQEQFHDDDENKSNTESNRRHVAILDVDYHCGNGTASIFYSDPSVLVVSLHCDPDFEYPFHSGFEDETGEGEGKGTTLHVPLPPQTNWSSYKEAMERALERIQTFAPDFVVVSLGLDTYNEDPCAIRRAGFCLEGDDYRSMGTTIAHGLKNVKGGAAPPPVLFVQEGGYRMDENRIGKAATDVVTSFSEAYTT